MKYEHILILLKADSQKDKAEREEGRWIKLNEQIGQWKKDFPVESDKCLDLIWKNGKRKQIPVLYGKQGVLQIIPPSSFEHVSNLFKLPNENFDVVEPSYFSLFNGVKTKDEEFIRSYEEWSTMTMTMKEFLEDTSSTFENQEKIEEVEILLQKYESIETEVKGWLKKNQADIIRKQGKTKNYPLDKLLSKYKKHFAECVNQEITLVEKNYKTVICSNCEGEWAYDTKIKRLNILNMVAEEEAFMKKAIVQYEKQKEMEKELVKDGKEIQKKYKSVDLHSYKELKKEFETLLKGFREESFQVKDMVAIVESITSILKLKNINKYQFTKDILSKYELLEIEKDIKKICNDGEIPKTVSTIEKNLKKMTAMLNDKRQEWEEYQKNVIKHTPTSYSFGSVVLTSDEIKSCLTLLKDLDGNYGYHLVADVLKGSKQKKIYEFNLQKSPYYGYFNRFTKTVTLDILHGFEDKNWLVQKGYDYPKIHITKKGLEQINRLKQKELLLTNDEDVVESEKKKFLSQDLEIFLGSLDTVIPFEEWKIEYFDNKYKERGIEFYKNMLQYYKEMKTENELIEQFLENQYDDKFKPIYQYYKKNNKNKMFLSFIQRILTEDKIVVHS